MPIATGPELGGDLVRVRVLLQQIVDLGVGDGVHSLDQVVDAVCVHGHAEPQLGLDLVTLGYGDVAHVVSEPGELEAADGGDAACCPLPAGNPRLRGRIGHVSGDRGPGHAEPGLDVAE